MTCINMRSFQGDPLGWKASSAAIDRFFLSLVRQQRSEVEAAEPSFAARTGLEKRLSEVQDELSKVSMHLPEGFATGLSRQFANMLDEDAWEEDDELISLGALSTFIQLLRSTGTKKRPGIGTNGRGSVTAAWTVGENRLTIECLPSTETNIVLSRRAGDGIERADYSSICPKRVREVLSPFSPEVWFDG